MTISARRILIGGCLLLYLGSASNAFVTPAGPATKPSRRVSTTTTASLFGAAASQPQTSGSGRRKRRRGAIAPLRASLPSSSPREAGRSQTLPLTSRTTTAAAAGRPGAAGARFMADGDSPVDAELSDPESSGSTDGGDEGVAGGVEDERGAVPLGDPATRAALKQKLLGKVATLNRGFVAQEADRVDVEEIIEMLEMENPNPKACEAFESGSSPLAGRWKLLYTTSLDVLSLQINPAVTVGQIFQEIEQDGRGIQNIIELQPPFAAVNKLLGSSMATLTVKLKTEPVSSSRVNLQFVRTEIEANSFFGRKLDLPTLGVNIPSAESIEKLLPKAKGKGKGKGGGGGGGLKDKVQATRTKARGLVRKIKGGKGEEEDSAKTAAQDKETEAKKEDEGGPANAAAEGEEDKEAPQEGIASPEGAKGEEGGEDDAEASPVSSSSRTPYFESTYVDEDLRVGRTGQGDVFVSVRA